jgi:hypothetical protein
MVKVKNVLLARMGHLTIWNNNKKEAIFFGG